MTSLRVVIGLLAALGALEFYTPPGAAGGSEGVMSVMAHRSSDTFDHAVHSGLFPTCTGCHSGATAGDRPMFPEEASCSACHDGQELDRVDWAGPTAVPSNLTYDHLSHASAALNSGEGEASCISCHDAGGAVDVIRGQPESCSSCHAHAFTDHLDDAECVQCHSPLSSSSLNRAAIDALPRPTDHLNPTFLAETHGADLYEANRCATCHTSDRCVACHVEPGLPRIQGIGSAPPAMELPDFGAEYPLPPDHQEDDWPVDHWGPINTAADCSTCHTSDDCTTCHSPQSSAQGAISSLPAAAEVRAPGLNLQRRPTADHASRFFEEEHRIVASTATSTCGGCHVEDQCVACHEAARGPQYHPSGYEAGHAADAFGAFLDCSSCHDTAVFCRSCHIESGIGGGEGLTSYHDAEPFWLLRHGQAARQTLDSCASCHEQRDCTSCHSEVGAFRVSPHGPDFDARAAWEKNFRACGSCHIGNPIRP